MSADSKLPTDNTCLFCRIVSGEIAADILHRDETVLAFRDVKPVAPTHILIIPTRHIASLREHDGEGVPVLDHMGMIARSLADQEGLAASGYRLVINSGADAGQTVFHLHMHLLGGRKMHWPPG